MASNDSDIFVLTVKFRCGILVSREGNQCMHVSCKIDEEGTKKEPCGKALDTLGDHAASCATGGHLFSRHGGLNNIVADAGRAAGYQVLMEQVVPDFARWKRNRSGELKLEEARLDIELFGHPVAPSRYIDGTIRHPAAKSVVVKSSSCIGHAASEGEGAKWKRYVTKNGKKVIPCSMETWGSIGGTFEALLRDLAVMASRRQCERGIHPTNWYAKWTLQLSLCVTLNNGKVLFESLPNAERYVLCRRHGEINGVGVEASLFDRDNLYPGSGRLNTPTQD